jgi:acyl-CoA dehydrogenase
VIELAPPLSPSSQQLRSEVRAFLSEAMSGVPYVDRADSWMRFDREFSLKLGRQGWIGMTLPREYGGGARSALDRYVVIEELLAAGAPVAAHLIADRQSGPLILRYGTEAMKRAILPGIARGELSFCIGMSESEAGSDLAGIRTRADRTSAGWRIDGAKLWTTFAHKADYMIALVRTSGAPADRHAGLSQLLVDLRTPGLEIRAIRDLGGYEKFNEVVFHDVVVAEAALIGNEGEGWSQVIAELAFERSGPERYLSSFALLLAAIDVADPSDERVAIEIGRLYAELSTLRQMSLGVAELLQRGEDPALAAAIVKDLGTSFEQRLPEVVHDLFGRQLLAGGDVLSQVQARVTESAPSFSLRGGTREVLRNIIGKGLLR